MPKSLSLSLSWNDPDQRCANPDITNHGNPESKQLESESTRIRLQPFFFLNPNPPGHIRSRGQQMKNSRCVIRTRNLQSGFESESTIFFLNPNPDSGFLALNRNPNSNPAQNALNLDSNLNPDMALNITKPDPEASGHPWIAKGTLGTAKSEEP